MNTTTEALTQKKNFFPFCLSDAEIMDPIEVFNNFCDASDLQGEKQRLDKLLRAISRSDAYDKKTCYDLVDKEYRRLIEAAFLLVHSHATREIAIERFLALFAHEIKSQLAGASLAVESLIDKTDSFFATRPDVAFYLTTLQSILFNSMFILKNMINTACFREECFALRAEEAPFNVAAFIDDCTIACHILDERFNKNLIVGLNDLQHTTIVTDKVKLGQVVQNFLHNAYKYSEGREIQLIAAESDGHISFSVLSYGHTISAQEINKLMRLYYHAGPGETGYGIGLYLCELYAETLRGKIEITSNDGLTCFSIRIPCKIRK